MNLKHIELRNFRNYKSLSLDFSSKKTLLIGKNAQGKTNLLESVYYLSSLDSMKAKHDAELITWEEDFSIIKADLIKNDIDLNIEVTVNPPKKKILKVNGIKKSKSSEFLSNLTTVCFSVSDLLLLRGGPEDRRKWLDLAISQLYPAFSERLSKFNKIKIQKNNYLKSLKANINEPCDLLDIWNEQLAITGSNIIYLRLMFLKEMQKTANIKHNQISPNEYLSLVYNSTFMGDINFENFDILTTDRIAEMFKEELNRKRNEEIIRAQSLAGPHRDDISYFINGNDSKKFASQGQQRTIVLSLKLAELELIKNKNGENPILLLDDVLAELDNIRQNFLLNSIDNDVQTIITSVDTLHFEDKFLKDVEIFTIKTDEDNFAFVEKL